jgi:hypothetical protein
MSISTCEDLRASLTTSGPLALCDALIAELRDRQDYHKLFDALCLRKKQEMGLPLGKPTSLEDVPTDRRDDFEQSYMAAAREVGQLLIAAGKPWKSSRCRGNRVSNPRNSWIWPSSKGCIPKRES